ncbi:hypothetical protein FHS21_003524 [Phyllobacterium trifolii]|uniref:Uncharacterized protein n=1 Tax=Phyllobacterium trifolii TaxID=300193 RepID=A0A839U8I7_9HYPH|nr:hypothetical protein [Phyllobacterium trifolii]MBB3147108.1 hypothetical protein [Phyllobacterium trifolii]
MVASTKRSIEATIKDRGAGFDLIIVDAPGVDSSLQTDDHSLVGTGGLAHPAGDQGT